jgi:hypothetical protein
MVPHKERIRGAQESIPEEIKNNCSTMVASRVSLDSDSNNIYVDTDKNLNKSLFA